MNKEDMDREGMDGGDNDREDMGRDREDIDK